MHSSMGLNALRILEADILALLILGSVMAELLTIFISPKMPKDSDTTSSIGQLIATHSGNKIKINLAEDFRKGSQLSSDITKAIQTADIFLLLYTGEDQDWGYCLLEA